MPDGHYIIDGGDVTGSTSTTTSNITDQLNGEATTSTIPGIVDGGDANGTTTTTSTTTAATTTTSAPSGRSSSSGSSNSGSSRSSGGSSRSTNSPKTGDKGVGTVMAVIALAATALYCTRSKKDE